MEVYQPWLQPASRDEYLQQGRDAAQRVAGAKRKHPEGEAAHDHAHGHTHDHEGPHDHDHVHEVSDLFVPCGLRRCSIAWLFFPSLLYLCFLVFPLHPVTS